MKTFEEFVNNRREVSHVCVNNDEIPNVLIQKAGVSSFVGFFANIEEHVPLGHPTDIKKQVWQSDEDKRYEIEIIDDYNEVKAYFVFSRKQMEKSFRELTPTEKTSMKFGI